MKKLLLFALASFSLAGSAQIETSLNWAGIGPTGGLNFFLDDSTDLVTIDCDYHTGYALFTDPKDSLLYGLFRGTGETYGDNNLYRINPFNGEITLAIDFAGTEFTSATINTDGSTIYLINGGGVATLGDIIAYDVETGTEALLTSALGEEGTSTYGMTYHPLDDQLYIYEGSEIGDTRLQKIDVSILSNEHIALTGFDGFITGAMWQGVDYEFIVNTAYDCSFLKTEELAPDHLEEFYNSCMPETSDLANIHTIYAESDSIAICPETGDFTSIELMYDVNSFEWYKDGVLLTDETETTLTIDEPGVYQAAMEIKTTTAMLFSQEITVYLDPACTSSIDEQMDNLISVYPNPVQNTLTIAAEANIQSITINDLKGNVLYTNNQGGSNNTEIDFSDLKSGIYLVEVITDNGNYIKKIVK